MPALSTDTPGMRFEATDVVPELESEDGSEADDVGIPSTTTKITTIEAQKSLKLNLLAFIRSLQSSWLVPAMYDRSH